MPARSASCRAPSSGGYYFGADNQHLRFYEMMVQTTAYKFVNDEAVKPAQKQ